MNQSCSFPQLPECDRCHFSTGNTYLPCTVHPLGVTGEQCLDFQEDPIAAERHQQFLRLDWVRRGDRMAIVPYENPWDDSEDLWEPEGASYRNGELIINPELQLVWAEEDTQDD